MPLTIRKSRNLEAAAHDVCYEMMRLGDALTIRKQFCSGGREESLARLLLEAFLLHYRNIRDFLMNADKHPDDITASHFNLYWQGVPGKTIRRKQNRETGFAKKN